MCVFGDPVFIRAYQHVGFETELSNCNKHYFGSRFIGGLFCPYCS